MVKNLAQKIGSMMLFSMLIFLSSCGDRQLQKSEKENGSEFFSKCENTFVVSGSRKIYLFEHYPNSVEFEQLAAFDDWSPLSPYLDCENHRIVVPYGARKEDRNNAGVAIIELDSGTKTEYPVKAKGIQGIPLKYDNGLLLSTTLLKQTDSLETPPQYGYLPPGESYKDGYGSNYRLHAPTTYFDLSRLEFTKDLDLDLGYSVIQNKTLYAMQRGAITAIDLQGKTTDILYESKAKNIPANHLGVFLDGEYYMVLNRYSQNKPNGKLNGYDSNAIYKLVDGEMRKLSHYPDADAVYLLGLNNKLYLFTESLQVIEYDIQTKALVERNPLITINMSGYSIESVGYNHQNFIMALDHPQNDSSKVILISQDFTQISAAKTIDLRLISITTDVAIDTADSRGIQPSVNKNVILR